MIQKGTKLEIVDNTGALLGKCINVYNRKTGKLGSKILLSILEEEYNMSGKWKGTKQLGIVTMTSSIGGKNKCVLIKEVSSLEIELLGTTIKDPIAKELERVKGLEKIVELGEEVI